MFIGVNLVLAASSCCTLRDLAVVFSATFRIARYPGCRCAPLPLHRSLYDCFFGMHTSKPGFLSTASSTFVKLNPVFASPARNPHTAKRDSAFHYAVSHSVDPLKCSNTRKGACFVCPRDPLVPGPAFCALCNEQAKQKGALPKITHTLPPLATDLQPEAQCHNIMDLESDQHPDNPMN